MTPKNLRPSLRNSPLLLPAVFLALLLGPATTRADEIALFNFNDTNLIVDRGAGTLSTTFGAGFFS
ncbi:MAG: hypothetical protein ACRD9R_16110, partial [Pyrinomonadaceae bacterium]